MALSEATWAEIRRAYEAGDETVAGISARYEISQGAIYRRARVGKWDRSRRMASSGDGRREKKRSRNPEHSLSDRDAAKPLSMARAEAASPKMERSSHVAPRGNLKGQFRDGSTDSINHREWKR